MNDNNTSTPLELEDEGAENVKFLIKHAERADELDEEYCKKLE